MTVNKLNDDKTEFMIVSSDGNSGPLSCSYPDSVTNASVPLSPLAAIDSWIQCTLVSLCYSYKDSTVCGYLTELLKAYKPTCHLRTSSDTAILCLPSVYMHMYAWSVSYAALYIWYSLLWKVWSSSTLTSFRSWLKSHIFKLSYWLPVHTCQHVCSYKLVFELYFGSLFCNGLCAPIWKKYHLRLREYIIIII